jgi:hypothetical protein
MFTDSGNVSQVKEFKMKSKKAVATDDIVVYEKSQKKEYAAI